MAIPDLVLQLLILPPPPPPFRAALGASLFFVPLVLMICLYAGTENFKKIVITKIQGKFKGGKHMEGTFRYVGLDITQTEEGVIAEQNNYISSIQPIPISLKR